MSQRGRTLNGRDLIKRFKREKWQVRRKTVFHGGKQSGNPTEVSLLSRLREIQFQFLRLTTGARTTVRMVPAKLAGISIFVLTLSFRTLAILGESVLTSDIDKSGELKASDKRGNNFGVPMEMPYDTSFWPSRGRRGRHPLNDICYISDRNFVFLKRCQPLRGQEDSPRKKWPLADTDLNSSGEPDNHLLGGNTKLGNDCCESVTEGPGGGFSTKTSDVFDMSPLFGQRRFEELRNEKQRHFVLPRVLLYGNGMLWRQGNPFAEKKKKEDVFWVARGKKNSFSWK